MIDYVFIQVMLEECTVNIINNYQHFKVYVYCVYCTKWNWTTNTLYTLKLNKNIQLTKIW